MIQICNNAQAIQNNQADIAFGSVAAAVVGNNHRVRLHSGDMSMSPGCCLGERTRPSKRAWHGSIPPVSVSTPSKVTEVAKRQRQRSYLTDVRSGSPLWAALVIQRSVS